MYIDSTLYYYGTENESEAYYICGMLNIPDLYRSIKLISDTRHHHKRPLYFNTYSIKLNMIIYSFLLKKKINITFWLRKLI